jgi:hypothetical protein
LGAPAGAPSTFGQRVVSVEADWDDETGQTEVRADVEVSASGGNVNQVSALSFFVTIVAAV